ncbi:MAG: putative Histidine kinase [Nitrospira sp.]|nr:putative Histidine kinase [Nitrospira sp.]MDF2458528.1 putative Histidine kinase [Nitrospira sp.]
MVTAPACTVLNVDDNDAVRYARGKILQQAGYQVLEACTGSEALELARSEHPALIVLDVKLPDISGIDVCQQLRQDPRTAPILVLQISAYFTSSDDHALGLEYADSYLTEPVAPQEFLASVQALLRLHRREEEYRHLLRDVSLTPGEHSIPLAEKWAAAQDEIRRLADQLSTVEEHEQKKLAQSLHDDLAQLLVVARMKLQHQRHRPADDTVEEIDTVLARCLTYTRSLMSDLLPPQLQEGRLDIALQWLSDTMREHGLIVVVEAPEFPVVVAEHLAMTILKCVRELLFNVLKHAGTNEAFVSLEVSEGLIRVVVQDHGKGCTATVPEPSALHSFGLSSVQQRLHQLGGRLEITSQPGVGTRATVTAPFASLPSA